MRQDFTTACNRKPSSIFTIDKRWAPISCSMNEWRGLRRRCSKADVPLSTKNCRESSRPSMPAAVDGSVQRFSEVGVMLLAPSPT